MKKAISIIAVCMCMILPGGLFGCAPKGDKAAIVGKWVRREENPPVSVYEEYTFYDDSTAEYYFSSKEMREGGKSEHKTSDRFDFRLNGKSELIYEPGDGRVDMIYTYAFNDDYTVLTLNVDGETLIFNKQE